MTARLNAGNTRPEEFIASAKARAHKCRHQKAPKLTALEMSFWNKLRKTPRCKANS